MSAPSAPSAPSAVARRRLGTVGRAGLALAGLLGVLDLLSTPGAPLAPQPAPGENGPPAAVLWFSCVMGLLTVVGVVVAWRTGSRAASRVIAATRVLSTLTTLPAFFVGGVPAWLVALAAVSVLLNAAAVFLVLRRPPAEPA